MNRANLWRFVALAPSHQVVPLCNAGNGHQRLEGAIVAREEVCAGTFECRGVEQRVRAKRLRRTRRAHVLRNPGNDRCACRGKAVACLCVCSPDAASHAIPQVVLRFVCPTLVGNADRSTGVSVRDVECRMLERDQCAAIGPAEVSILGAAMPVPTPQRGMKDGRGQIESSIHET